jgi:hypothetical protein
MAPSMTGKNEAASQEAGAVALQKSVTVEAHEDKRREDQAGEPGTIPREEGMKWQLIAPKDEPTVPDEDISLTVRQGVQEIKKAPSRLIDSLAPGAGAKEVITSHKTVPVEFQSVKSGRTASSVGSFFNASYTRSLDSCFAGLGIDSSAVSDSVLAVTMMLAGCEKRPVADNLEEELLRQYLLARSNYDLYRLVGSDDYWSRAVTMRDSLVRYLNVKRGEGASTEAIDSYLDELMRWQLRK